MSLAVTMDKVKYVLRKLNVPSRLSDAPIRPLSIEEIINRLWKGHNSLVHSLIVTSDYDYYKSSFFLFAFFAGQTFYPPNIFSIK